MPSDAYSAWPYATSYLRHTLDPDVIEKHARLILARALNLDRVIGFVGAGASMSYGRISWRDLVLAEAAHVKEEAEAQKELGPLSHEVESLLETMKSLMDESNVQPDKYPMIFQVAEQLDSALKKDALPGPRSRNRASSMAFDDRGHALGVLRKALKARKDRTAGGADVVVESMDKSWDSSAVRLLFNRGKLAKLAELIQSGSADPEVQAFASALLEFSRDGDVAKVTDDKPLQASQRHRIGALLTLANALGLSMDNWWENLPIPPTVRDKDDQPACPVTRDAMVPKMRDPLALLEDHLKIRRFITTNYDHEIELLFKYLGYQMTGSGPQPQRLAARIADPSMLHAAFDAYVFDKEKPGELLAFAARGRGHAGVIHLHGRAEAGGEGNIVVTEGDYQALYLSPENRAPISDALDVTFGGNPILFIGSGMGEDDILRPLRQFMSTLAWPSDRVAIALLPGRDTIKKRTAEKVTLFNRFGVYAIHFGAGGFKLADDKLVEVEWLTWLASLHKSLKAVLAAPMTEDGLKEENPLKKYAEYLFEHGVKADQARRAYKDALISGPRVISHKDFEPSNDPIWFDPVKRILLPLHEVERVNIDLLNNCNLRAEVQLFNKVLAVVENVSAQDPSWPQLAKASQVILDGAMEAATSAFLCASIVRIRNEWHVWKADWFTPPASRPVNKNESLLLGDIRIHRRHAQAVGSGPDKTRRFYADAPSHTFIAMNQSLEACQELRAASGRRVLVLMGRRGGGKGNFFISLAGPSSGSPGAEINKNLTQFLAALGPAESKWSDVAFINLNFSREVMSAFDRIIEVLRTAINPARATTEDPGPFADDRLGRLRQALLDFRAARTAGGPRVLVFLHGVEVLFERGGKPKNPQIGDLFKCLFETDIADAPLDIVLNCQDEQVPLWLRSGALHIEREHVDPQRELSDRDRVKAVVGEYNVASRIADNSVVVATRQQFIGVHVLRPARAVVIATTYFPEVALALISQKDFDGLPIFDDRELSAAIQQALPREAEDAPYAKILLPAALVILACLIEREPAKSESEESPPLYWSGKLTTILSGLKAAWIPQGGAEWLAGYFKGINDTVSDPLVIERRIIAFDRDAHSLYTIAGKSRFALTMLLAWLEAAGRLGPSARDHAKTWPGRKEENPYRRAVRNVHTHMKEANRLSRQGSADDAPDGIADSLLAIVSRRLESDDPGMGRIVEELVWHLAIIGQPVEAKVLAQCPRLREACKKRPSRAGKDGVAEGEEQIDLELKDGLDLAVEHCLIHEIGGDQPRYAVHRLIQKRTLRKLGAPNAEAADSERFTISLYASQPDALPKLEAQDHQQIIQCFDLLSGYPVETGDAEQFGQEKVFADKARRLRAAYGIIRSVYSLAVLARFEFSDETHADGGAEEGYFEALRRRIRWLLRAAQELSAAAVKEARSDLPFYSEELVWLYNECGLLSFVQGRLNDAEALFKVGLEVAHRIEPDDGRPLLRRLLLNKALVDIEAGRPGLARKILAPIAKDKKDPHVASIASGYLGLIAHLHGDFAQARTLYTDAIVGLRDPTQTRALSIFHRHYADLLTALEEGGGTGRQEVADAINFAQMGGHEDVRQLAVLARCRQQIASDDPAAIKARPNLHLELDGVERYARMVGMPRLLCEVHQARSRLLIVQGERTQAGTLAARSLEIACANNLKLRKTLALLLLAEINEHGPKGNVEPILDLATQMAKSSGHFVHLTRANQLAARLAD